MTNKSKAAGILQTAAAEIFLIADFILLVLKFINTLTTQNTMYPPFTAAMCLLLALSAAVTALTLLFKPSKTALYTSSLYCIVRMLVFSYDAASGLDALAVARFVLTAAVLLLLQAAFYNYKSSTMHIFLKVSVIIFCALLTAISLYKILPYITFSYWIFNALFFTLSDVLFFAAIIFIALGYDKHH